MPSPLVILDVNAWKDYFRSDEPPLLQARARLRRATELALVRPMLTAGVVSELAGASEPEGHARYCEMMLFAWEVSAARLLATEQERCNAEIFWERKLTLDQALVTPAGRQAFRDHCMLDAKWARGVAATVAEAQDANHAEERAKVRVTVEELDARDAKEAKEAAEANDGRELTPWRSAIMKDDDARAELIASWALDGMVATAMHLGLPFARDRLPDPRTLPSFYLVKVVHVKRIHGVLLGGRSPTNTDVFDLNALQDAACYADVFVTSDRDLLKLAVRVGLPIRVIDFRTWDDELAVALAR